MILQLQGMHRARTEHAQGACSAICSVCACTLDGGPHSRTAHAHSVHAALRMVGYNLSGTIVIANYASNILGDTTRRLPVVIGLVQLAGLVSGATLADRLGRRPLIIASCGVAALGLFAMAGLLGLHSGAHDGHGAAHSAAAAETWVLLALMMAVEYAVGAGLNPVRIVLSAELMPNTRVPTPQACPLTLAPTVAPALNPNRKPQTQTQP